jgi:hypothetical protein
MPASRKGLGALVALALVCALALAGCAGGEARPVVAEARGGILGNVVAQLKREDDENETRELAEHEPVSKQEHEEAHEAEEEQEVQAAQAQEAEGQPEEQPPAAERQQAAERAPALQGQES